MRETPPPRTSLRTKGARFEPRRDALPSGAANWHSGPVTENLLPARFAAWFSAQGWQPHPHQLRMLAAARAGRTALLIAPTGGGKTLAGFLPSLDELAEAPR